MFEMPTPCDKCGEIFDLHDGVSFENIIYCEDCGSLLREIEEVKEEIDNLISQIEDAEYTLKTQKPELEKYKARLAELEG